MRAQSIFTHEPAPTRVIQERDAVQKGSLKIHVLYRVLDPPLTELVYTVISLSDEASKQLLIFYFRGKSLQQDKQEQDNAFPEIIQKINYLCSSSVCFKL